MSKFNKVKFGILVVFIVLLFANVQAAELDTVSGDGSSENPYVIEISPSSRMLKFQCKQLPFYFIMKEGSEGSYEINYDATTSEISFLQVQSADAITPQNEISVALDKEKYENIKNWQVGVDTNLSPDIGMSVPTYDIFEELEYLSSYNELNMSPPSLFGDFVSFDTNDPNVLWVDKSTKLYNIVIKNYVIASKPNQYFFTSSKKNSEAGELFEAMGFEHESNGIFAKYTYPETMEPIVYIPVTNNYADEKFNIVYKFGGYANTALNDTGEGSTNGLESLLTRNLIRIGDELLLDMLRDVLGENLSIDSLIFNRFESTKIDLYNTRATGVNKILRDVVNNWFGILLRITYVVYIILLVYIGIVAIMNAGTEKQNKFFKNLSNWIMGLLILTFVPTYGIPFLFDINEALVKYISKDSSTMKTYYNEYDINETDDILGSDSSTITIEELTALRAQVQQRYDHFSNKATTYMNTIKSKIKTQIKIKSGVSATPEEVVIIDSLLDDMYKNYKYYLDMKKAEIEPFYGKTKENIKYEQLTTLRESIISHWQSGKISQAMKDAFTSMDGILNDNTVWNVVYDRFDKLYTEEHTLEVIDETINIRQSDIMGTMRAYAGKYQKLIFAFIWYMLLFQLIGLTFLYYKRIFVIAILIAVFPIIMLFYCIDKMSDGSAQTLSLWFKELLANIFIQSVHAVIYIVLVEMGLTIYKNDPGNWMFLVAAMLMILPAESIMKEIFDLNGSTLRAVGGMLGKAALAIGTLKAFASAGKGANDASVKEKNEKRFNKLQRRQDRSDNRANIRAAKRAGNMKNYDADGKLKDLKGVAKLREGAYHLATDARKARAKVAPTVDSALRNARNVAAVTAGVMYGASGGDLESMAQGAMTAKALSGKTKNIDEFKLKTDLKSAYERKKKS